MLHARVAGYEPGWCDALYERREIFEAYNKGLSLVPSSEFPWFRATVYRDPPRLLAENAEVAARVLERCWMTSSSLEPLRKKNGLLPTSAGSVSVARSAGIDVPGMEITMAWRLPARLATDVAREGPRTRFARMRTAIAS